MHRARIAAPVFALVTAGCASAASQQTTYEETRAVAPPPACLMRLPPKAANDKGRSLREEEYWELVFPSFERSREALPDKALACTGRTVFDDPAFKGAARVSTYPAPVSEGDILVGGGGDRLRVIWLRTHKDGEGNEVGPLALVRAKNDVAEVYAVGVYKGRTIRPYFQLERIGYEAIVSVQDEDCTRKDYKAGTPCESTQALFLPRKGSLVALATFSTERRAFVASGEPGSYGLVEYHLTAAPRFSESGLVLSEQIVAIDPGGRELRHAEIERVFAIDDTKLTPHEEPLWPRIFPVKAEPSIGTKDPPAPKPAPVKPPPPPKKP